MEYAAKINGIDVNVYRRSFAGWNRDHQKKSNHTKRTVNTAMKKSEFINPIKEFVEEVHNDTVGDAMKFYSNVAKSAQKNAKAAKARAKARQEEVRRQQEEMKKHRKTMMKRATILFAVIIVAALIAVSVVLHVRVG